MITGTIIATLACVAAWIIYIIASDIYNFAKSKHEELMNFDTLSQPQQNLLRLCEGKTPEKIEFLLSLLKQSALNELMEAFHASNITDLSEKIAKQF